MENTKKCACCLITKDKTEFTKYKSNKDGLFSYCRACKSIKAKQDSIKNSERIRKYMKNYNANMPEKVKEKKVKRNKEWYKENKKSIKEASSIYYKKNKTSILEKGRKNYEKTKEEVKKRHKRWEDNNKAKRTEICTRRRSRLFKNGIFYISEKEINKLLSSKCYLCKTNPSEHLDHIIPICKGGVHSIGNLLGACQRCNLEKGSKTLFEYRRHKANTPS